MGEFKTIMQEAMAAKGYKASDICRLTKIPKSLVSYYLSGKVTPKLDKIEAICSVLDLDPEALKKEVAVKGNGLSRTRLWSIWHGMKQRCTDSKKSNFKHYGAKGVTVCAEWQESFLRFYEWAMAHGYREDLTLDRIDPCGNYTPENCRWVTWDIQAKNKRKESR